MRGRAAAANGVRCRRARRPDLRRHAALAGAPPRGAPSRSRTRSSTLERNGRRASRSTRSRCRACAGRGSTSSRGTSSAGRSCSQQGVPRDELYLHVAERACRSVGIEERRRAAALPDRARRPSPRRRHSSCASTASSFSARRRVKTDAELDGIRRAQRAAEAAMDRARELLRSADAERRRARARRRAAHRPSGSSRRSATCSRRTACVADEMIVSHGGQSAVGHEMGSGPIAPGEPIVIDLWPKDRETGCHADMTRTYCVGEPPEELVEYHRLVKQALDEAIAAVRAGASGNALFVGDLRALRGARLQDAARRRTWARRSRRGSSTASGTASGSRCTRIRAWASRRRAPLVAGDVVTVEPGLYRPGLRRLPPRGSPARHRGRLREPHRLPLRSRALMTERPASRRCSRRTAATRRTRRSRRRRTRSRRSTTCRSRSSGRRRRASA